MKEEHLQVSLKKFFVASTSKHKLGAVEISLKNTIQEPFLVEGLAVSSDVNEQPVGHEETLRGAINRLKHLKEVINQQETVEGPRMLVSFENGIYPVGEKWFDIAYVVVEDEKGNQAIAPSVGIEFPIEYILEAKRRGFATTTVGSVMAEKLGDSQIATDPQSYLTHGKLTRSKVLQDAFESALHQLVFKKAGSLSRHI